LGFVLRGRWMRPFLGSWILIGAALGCSKSSGESSAITTNGTRIVLGVDPTPGPSAGTSPTGPKTTRPDPVEYDGAPLVYTSTETVDSSVTHVDPNVSIIQGAQAAGANCFAGLQGGAEERSASIQVTVVPSGSVSRTEVSGASEPEVADCLRRVGGSLHFNPNDGSQAPAGGPMEDNQRGSIRSFSIDIRVARGH
jgi:hypothetical protein